MLQDEGEYISIIMPWGDWKHILSALDNGIRTSTSQERVNTCSKIRREIIRQATAMECKQNGQQPDSTSVS